MPSRRHWRRGRRTTRCSSRSAAPCGRCPQGPRGRPGGPTRVTRPRASASAPRPRRAGRTARTGPARCRCACSSCGPRRPGAGPDTARSRRRSGRTPAFRRPSACRTSRGSGRWPRRCTAPGTGPRTARRCGVALPIGRTASLRCRTRRRSPRGRAWPRPNRSGRRSSRRRRTAGADPARTGHARPGTTVPAAIRRRSGGSDRLYSARSAVACPSSGCATVPSRHCRAATRRTVRS